MRNFTFILPFTSLLFFSCGSQTESAVRTSDDSRPEERSAESAVDSAWSDTLKFEGEKNFGLIKKLTHGGDNAEAYWSFAGDRLVFQVKNEAWGNACDQIHVFNPWNDDVINSEPKMVSTGLGRTTCSYFMPGDSTILYASTHLGGNDCPPEPKQREDGKYVWPIYPSFDIFEADLKGNIIKQLTAEDGYDAEATLSPQGDKIVFTSMRTGDLELFTMDIDGSNVKQVTFELGYDGGAFFSPDGTQLIFRSSRPKSPEDIKTYKDLLKEGLVMPTEMELYICNVDGSELRQLTDLGKANWSPYWHPNGQEIIFASNHESERGFPFSLYMINADGSNLRQVTNDDVFAAFPVFSADGKHLVFSSNRHNGGTRETNLFLAEWKDL